MLTSVIPRISTRLFDNFREVERWYGDLGLARAAFGAYSIFVGIFIWVCLQVLLLLMLLLGSAELGAILSSIIQSCISTTTCHISQVQRQIILLLRLSLSLRLAEQIMRGEVVLGCLRH